jgi:hypothetical protein
MTAVWLGYVATLFAIAFFSELWPAGRLKSI